MNKELFMDNLYEQANNIKTQYKKLIGYAMFKDIDFLPFNVSESCNLLMKNDAVSYDAVYISELQKSFNETNDNLFNAKLNILVEQMISFRNFYIENKDNLDNDEYLNKRDFRILEYMTNFNLDFVLSHLYKLDKK